jgi:hypothetical protein
VDGGVQGVRVGGGGEVWSETDPPYVETFPLPDTKAALGVLGVGGGGGGGGSGGGGMGGGGGGVGGGGMGGVGGGMKAAHDKMARMPPYTNLTKVLCAAIEYLTAIDRDRIFANSLKTLPGYTDIIKKPISLGDMKVNLSKGNYGVLEDFCDDVALMVSNCFTYNNTVSRQQYFKVCVCVCLITPFLTSKPF